MKLNHYRLPMFYQYGVGSAGFDAVRELAAHVKMTNAVLAGQTAGFPLLYHFRVMPRLDDPTPRNPVQLREYLARWNNSKTIERYVNDRDNANRELWLFSEYISHQLYDWVDKDQAAIEWVIPQLFTTLDFLRTKGIVHFDAHLLNLLTDGSQTYICDFGLLLDPEFDLTTTERAFLARHEHYDYGEVLSSLHRFRSEPMHPSLAAAIERYRDVTVYMNTFFDTMTSNPKKNTRYDDVNAGGPYTGQPRTRGRDGRRA